MATFTFNSNTTVAGTNNADLLLGTDTAGNNNDIVYGRQGDDTIEGTFALNNSTLYGGQGNDVIYANNHNVIYGNQGKDFLEIFSDTFSGAYGNNNTIYGGQGDDTIFMLDPGHGNVAYGGAGNNVFFLGKEFKSTVVGGLGNDHIFGANSSVLLLYGSDPSSGIYGNDTFSLDFVVASTAYGGQGNDDLFSTEGTGNTLYTAGGNDLISVVFSNAEVLYGNQGNDEIFAANAFALTAYGGQGDDFVFQSPSCAHGVLYGNRGNDLVDDQFGSGLGNNSGAAEGNSVLYGGQGDDTLVALGAGGDTVFGGQGHNLFAANDLVNDLTVNDLITVGDFVSGNDSLSMSSQFSTNDIGLAKENDLFADNAKDAISFADNFYSTVSGDKYLFVSGGAGAGYLFYNGAFLDTPENAPTDGMILVGDNAESSLSANDIIASLFARF